MPAAHVVYLFPHDAEHRRVRKRPKPGLRVSDPRGDQWIVHEVFRSGTRTYTATCVAPGDFEVGRERVLAYLKRDWEFFSAVLFVMLGIAVVMTYATTIWIALLAAVAASALLVFAWATK